MHISLEETQLGLRNSTTRVPFRYGTACLSRCPQATLRTTIVCGGRRQAGFAGDCLPPSWFDKSPEKDFAVQISDMLRVIALSQRVYATEFASPTEFFQGWLAAHQRIQQQCQLWSLPPLLASFGASLLERAILDAICRRHEMSLATAIRENLFGIVPSEVHAELAGCQPADWLPSQPKTELFVRQTIGLGDPLTLTDVPPAERLTDGWPQAIEEYITRRGVRYFKIKVSNQLDRDLERLTRIALLLERHLGANYYLTLDGNEQYHRAEEFEELIVAIRRNPALATLWQNVLVIEQPLERKVALSAEHTGGIRDLSRSKPVIIDESDGTLQSYVEALERGYRGVSSKNCKGAIKSLLNAGLTWVRNGRGQASECLMTGEDLCSVGVIPTQSDLCLVATLGLTHVERNGHHYHPGLSYLPEPERRLALDRHGDFYMEERGIIGPRITAGQLRIGSLQCIGFGFAVEPDFSTMASPDAWTYESLGLESPASGAQKASSEER